MLSGIGQEHLAPTALDPIAADGRYLADGHDLLDIAIASEPELIGAEWNDVMEARLASILANDSPIGGDMDYDAAMMAVAPMGWGDDDGEGY